MNRELFSTYLGSLKHLAFDSKKSLGRRYQNDPDSMYFILDPFLLDREKIRLSKAYRKLADKRQVFPPNLKSTIRNRLIHTDDVENISTYCASILGLNVYLAEAIAKGHDIGHTPFGHLGEKLIRELSGNNFSHNIMSVVVAQKIERKGKGLNLIYETLEGILNHSSGDREIQINPNVTEEANLVKYSDKIGYTFSDLSDALKLGFLKDKSLPKLVKYFGRDQRQRVGKTCLELIKESSEEGKISFSKSECSNKFEELKYWMYQNVYYKLDSQGERIRIFEELKKISEFIKERFKEKIDPYLAIACMTDSEAKSLFKEITNNTVKELNYGFMETVKNFTKNKINIFDADLIKENFSRDNL